MNALESQLIYPLGDTLPESGHCLTVAPGVKWLRMALPFALNHINLWLVADAFQGVEGWAIVDTGIADPATQAAWERVLSAELDGQPITRVIVTHMHPDHVGNAHWLCDTLGVPLYMSMTDYCLSRALLASPSGSGGAAAAAHFAANGLNAPDDIDKVIKRAGHYGAMVPAMPQSYARLMHGQMLHMGNSTHGKTSWQLITGYGHSPEHMSLYCPELNVCISGDMLLPRISTNVAVWDMEPEGNSLPLFLDSIAAYLALPADVLVLPSHGKPFKNAHVRVKQLQDHHADRLAELVAAARAAGAHGINGVDAVRVLFNRELDLHQMTFALGEALAHLHMLWYAGTLKRFKSTTGVWQFALA